MGRDTSQRSSEVRRSFRKTFTTEITNSDKRRVAGKVGDVKPKTNTRGEGSSSRSREPDRTSTGCY